MLRQTSSPKHSTRIAPLWVAALCAALLLLPLLFTGPAYSANPRRAPQSATGSSDSGGASNAPPAVSITSPAAGATLAAPASFTVTAEASDPDGSITKVEFYSGETLIGTSTAAPFSVELTGLGPCTYFLTAKATDDDGAKTLSAPVLVSVSDGAVGEATPPDFKVAFFGGAEIGADTVALLNLVKGEGTQALVLLGDLDDGSAPAAWEAQLDAVLGPDFPVFALVGNHDAAQWDAPGGYRERVEARMRRLGITWCGTLGVQSAFHYKGVFFVFTAPDIDGHDLGNHDLYIRDQLAADHSVWSFAGWHKNMYEMQAGGIHGETGWGVYEEARRGGAFTGTAQEHSYFRTHLLSDVSTQTVADASDDFTLTPGESFVFVSGLGGESIREQEVTGDYIARIYASPCLPGDAVCRNAENYGALFGTFNVGGQQRRACFYFKDLNGNVADEFCVTSDVDVPHIASLSPASAQAGIPGLTLTVHGDNFIPQSVVYVNGSPRPTTFVNGGELTAELTAADLLNAGTLAVTVRNNVTGGGTSAPADFTVNNPLPAITSLSPPSALRGGGAFNLTINGTGFVNGSKVKWNGAERATTFVSPTQLTALITAADLASAGTFPVTVFNPTPGGGTSAPLAFTVNNAAPTIGSFSPTSATAGGSGFTLNVTGTGFVPGTKVTWCGSERTTTVIDSTHVSAQIGASDIASAGTCEVCVIVPPPGGGTTCTTFTINNPSPTLTSLSPSNATAGGAAFTLTVNGSNFVAGSKVKWNGTERTTTFVNPTQLTAQVTAADIASAGSASVTVMNPTPGGGTSAPLPFTINNPAPALTSLSPPGVTRGSAAIILTVNGSGFVESSVVRWGGVARTTAYISPTELRAAIFAGDLDEAGTIPVTVFNPLPGGGTSSAVSFSVNNPAPLLTGLSPASGVAGGTAFTLTVTGADFVTGAKVRWNGSDRPTTFVNSSQLTTQITAADLATAGSASVTVFNPAPGGGESGALNFPVNNPSPAIGSLSPSSATAGAAAFTLTVNGTGFVPGSVVRWNGVDRPTTYVSPTQLTAQIPASDVSANGIATVRVFTPGPGGGTSTALPFNVNNPVPTLASLSPSMATAGDSGFTLTLTGTNFTANSVARWNGADRPTVYVGPTQLTAQINAADIASAGTFPVTVTNPAPGGGTTAAVNFTVKQANAFQFETTSLDVSESAFGYFVNVRRTGDLSTAASVAYATTDGTARERSDYTTADGLLEFAPGESQKSFPLLMTQDSAVEGTESATVELSNPSGGMKLGSPSVLTFNIIDDASEPDANTNGDTRAFVRQHYHDFLNREPDPSGWDFWVQGIESCGADQGCREVKRIHTSAAFFLSIEFQQTGFYVYRIYKAALPPTAKRPLGLPRYREFMRDTQEVGRGVVVLQGNWEQKLEQNKSHFVDDFVQRQEFLDAYPESLGAAGYVDALNANTGWNMPYEECAALEAGLLAGTETRATVLRKMAEHGLFSQQQFNRAFVLMQYYGYLRRNPDSGPDVDFAGYNFWLTKLDNFGGDFVRAEMVKAFLISLEYRSRFGRP